MIPSLTGEGDVGAVKKNIAIFTYKHWVFSLDMKTKVARHVPRIAFQNKKFQNFKISWFPACVLHLKIFYLCFFMFYVFYFGHFSPSIHPKGINSEIRGCQLECPEVTWHLLGQSPQLVSGCLPQWPEVTRHFKQEWNWAFLSEKLPILGLFGHFPSIYAPRTTCEVSGCQPECPEVSWHIYGHSHQWGNAKILG